MTPKMSIRAALFLLAGGFAAQHSRVAIGREQCALAILAALLMLLFYKRRSFALCVAAFVVGAVLFVMAALETVDKRIDEKYVGDSLLTIVRVIDFPRNNGVSQTFLVAPLADARLPPRSRVSWFDPPDDLQIGQVWQLELRLKRPRGVSSPGAFDREGWLFREQVHAVGYVVSGKRNRILGAGELGLRDAIRQDFVRRVDAVSSDPAASAILLAVAIGTRHRLSAAQWEYFSISGTSHLIAISGLHIGMAASVGFLITAALAGILVSRRNSLVIAAAGGACFAACYAYVSGFGVPALRATIMLSAITLAVIARRELAPLSIVIYAAVLVYVVTPTALLSTGFWLSFGAVLLLLCLSKRSPLPSQREGPALAGRAVRHVRGLLVMQWFLFFGLLPATIIGFHRVAVIAPFANLVAVPIFSVLVVPTALVSLFFGGSSSWVSSFSVAMVESVIGSFESLMQTISGLAFADVEAPGLFGMAKMLPAVLIAALLLPSGWPGRGIILIVAVTMVCYEPPRPPRNCVQAHVIDVGQGSANVIQTRSKTLIYDTGMAYRSGGSAAEQVLIPFLRDRGIRRVDWLVVSHGDNDHAGGVAALVNRLPVTHVFNSGSKELSELKADRCERGDSWQEDGVVFKFLHPNEHSPQSTNNSSCLLRVSVGDFSLLLPGDIEAEGEQIVLNSGNSLRSEVVVIPHHGSSTSSKPAFVAATKAKLAIASTGFGNQWGFPRPEIVARWRQAGAQVLDTATSGTVSFRLCESRGLFDIVEYRRQQTRIWSE